MQWLNMATTTVPMFVSRFGDIKETLMSVGDALGLLGDETDVAAASEAAAVPETEALDVAMDANPILLVVGAIGAIVSILAVATDGFKNWTPVLNVFRDGWNDTQSGNLRCGECLFRILQLRS